MAVAAHVVPVVIATVPFYILQICMIVFICCRRRKDEVFRTGFYTVYVALSIADCALMTVVVVFGVAANLGLFPEFYQQCTACASFMYVSSEYLHIFQLLAHAAIAVNRFTCFGEEHIHNRLWSGRGLRLITLGLLIAPLVLTSYQLPFGAHYSVVNGSITAARKDSETLNQVMKLADCAMYSTLTCVEFALIVGAIIRVRRFKAAHLPAQRRIQIKLLAYTVYMTFVQMLRALFFVAMALYLQIPWFLSIIYTFHPLIELYCFSGTVFLLLASSHTREAFLNFYRIRLKENCLRVEPRSASGYQTDNLTQK